MFPLVWLKVHPRLDGLRGEPRFGDLLARSGWIREPEITATAL